MSTSEKVTLIIGASLNSDRYSNKAFHRLKAANHKVYNIGFREGVLEDLKIYKEHQLDWSTIDTVTLYLGPARQELYYDYLLKLKPKRVIFNPGTENEELENILKEAGIQTEQACTLVLLSTNQY
ncbi:CoA-binding protein [Flavobacteriaceae bacterium]|jgi:predicted CoA-binding protein|uniref:CoA-binding protein n=1 Tax=Candidatus Arcticimaribacter forsetii TaxID=2820661 RepID=UPI002076F092|nr:CoA-binding protein [Candidatus Arcticimaribacter forsetii]MDB2345967.1 CoA-binding protein [Flavobacteriaceae bacterium]MDB2457122.1 CoA-binding protein [Flavobacteriaceae bacterium]MDB4620887.1 CoA-binding protein [Flavobacteriaceae bacterium]MDB4675107.1 CoA-binding protein [Flavobacteriaceae bacterium]MDB4752105.1 CoA-binding protein [Flavobacteriaceae bacterium]